MPHWTDDCKPTSSLCGSVMKEEVKENKAKVAKMEVAYKEGLKRDEELKKTKDTLAVKSAFFTRR